MWTRMGSAYAVSHAVLEYGQVFSNWQLLREVHKDWYVFEETRMMIVAKILVNIDLRDGLLEEQDIVMSRGTFI